MEKPSKINMTIDGSDLEELFRMFHPLKVMLVQSQTIATMFETVKKLEERVDALEQITAQLDPEHGGWGMT